MLDKSAFQTVQFLYHIVLNVTLCPISTLPPLPPHFTSPSLLLPHLAFLLSRLTLLPAVLCFTSASPHHLQHPLPASPLHLYSTSPHLYRPSLSFLSLYLSLMSPSFYLTSTFPSSPPLHTAIIPLLPTHFSSPHFHFTSCHLPSVSKILLNIFLGA